jgi:uncharacterized alkaline shock family protein YloU
MTRPADGVVDGVDVDRVAAAVAACPAVARLTGGIGGLGTYLPGRRVPGVVVRESAGPSPPKVEVHVVARYGPTMREVASQVRTALAALIPASAVDVIIDDVDTEPPPLDVVDAVVVVDIGPLRLTPGAP